MRINISGPHLVFPPSCACCARKADAELPLSARKTVAELTVPYCNQCFKHVRAVDFANLVLKIACGTALIFGFLLWFLVAPLLGILIALLGVMIAVIIWQGMVTRAKKQCGPKCVGEGRAVKYAERSANGHRLDIISTEYAYVFMVANQRNLGDLPAEAQALLESRGAARSGAARK